MSIYNLHQYHLALSNWNICSYQNPNPHVKETTFVKHNNVYISYVCKCMGSSFVNNTNHFMPLMSLVCKKSMTLPIPEVYLYLYKLYFYCSTCAPKPASCDWNVFNSASDNYFKVYGALVGGPDNQDNYLNDRKNVAQSEVACDYNAGFQSAIAGSILHKQNWYMQQWKPLNVNQRIWFTF